MPKAAHKVTPLDTAWFFVHNKIIHVYEKRTNFADTNHVRYRKILRTDSNLFAATKKKKCPIYNTNYVAPK